MIPINKKKKIKKDGKKVRVFIEKEIPEDTELLAFLQPYQEKGQVELSKVIGSVEGTFIGERKIVRSQETNLGNLIARIHRLKVGADVGVMGAGGIRTSLQSGEITYKDVLKVHPFSNTIGLVTLSGKELKNYLETAANRSAGTGAFGQFDNVEIVMKGNQLESLKVAGVPVDENKHYKLAVNSFMAGGGDGYVKITDHPTYLDSGFVDADLMREFIQKNSPLKASDYAPTNKVTRK